MQYILVILFVWYFGQYGLLQIFIIFVLKIIVNLNFKGQLFFWNKSNIVISFFDEYFELIGKMFYFVVFKGNQIFYVVWLCINVEDKQVVDNFGDIVVGRLVGFSFIREEIIKFFCQISQI